MPHTIAILGAGNVGTALAAPWLWAGHAVRLAVRGEPDARVAALVAAHPGTASAVPATAAVQGADVVLVAVPSAALLEAVAAAGVADGTIVIDATNPVAPGFTHALPTGSNAERLAAAHPGLRVAKAFNTVGANVMAAPQFASGPTVMPLCGDDAEARAVVASLARDAGFEPLEAGPLSRARLLEHVALFWIATSTIPGGAGRDFAFGLLRR